jgi:hypothetical protein
LKKKWELWEVICMTASQSRELCAGYAGDEEGYFPREWKIKIQELPVFAVQQETGNQEKLLFAKNSSPKLGEVDRDTT